MSSKGKQLSVLIAGATGSTGSELVSRLVSHPDVARVVALSRTPIPVNRWRTKFPNIHTGDALRCLSVVSVDWEKIAADAAHIPLSYVRDGEWSSEEVEKINNPGIREKLHMMCHSAKLGFMRIHGERMNDNEINGKIKNSKKNGHNAHQHHHSDEIDVDYLNDENMRRLNKSNNSGSFRVSSSVIGSTTLGSGVTGYVKLVSDPSASIDARKSFLNALLQTTFYKTVFSGHHVAINCLGSKNFFMRSEVSAVDHQYAIAFAKMVRLFNCMVHAEPSGEEEILMENHSKKLDRVLLGEIYAACYGRVDQSWFPTNSDANNNNNNNNNRSLLPQWPEEQLNNGGEATLKQFTQVSVMGSSLWSPLPYFRHHGACDEDLLTLFNRSDQSKRFGTRHFLSGKRKSDIDGDDDENENDDEENNNEEEDEFEKDPEARQRAEMLIRRDLVKLWDNAHVTIWRPGLLQRGNQRLIEKILGIFIARIDVEYFSEVIVDDIIASVEDERSFEESGSVKIVGGNSVAVRVKMKMLEENLNRRDTILSAFTGSQEEEKEEEGKEGKKSKET